MTAIPATALEVIKNPVGFYKKMTKTGGFISPLIFMVVMGKAMEEFFKGLKEAEEKK